MAGTFVDSALFPLDTLKTRLQSEKGFLKSGGFKGLYNGIGPVLIGAAPTAALFFMTYDSVKAMLQPRISEKYHSFIHMGAASLAELVACLVRVPVEVKKQRKQALILEKGKLGIRMLYRGYWSTVLRDMPFSLLQFPIWEYFKKIWARYSNREIKPTESALCGAIAGGISAAATTPLDVAKTRIMLSSSTACASELRIFHMLQVVYKEHGMRGLFAGIVPRVTWIIIGGFIFFGVYEHSMVIAKLIFPTRTISYEDHRQ
ncbi:S-adenosylmethionine mitochondrial carrier protein homolog isoform X2 [Cephus cinctus]|nr:S-adenosylmethionine mitochondrial carrier protein homolog isoform X2 [Cephus cinctus]